MKIKLIKPCIVGGKSAKPNGKSREVDDKEAKVLIASGKAVSAEPVKENVELTLNIDPKELEAVKAKIEQLTEENASLKAKIEQLTEENASLKSDSKEKKGK